MHTITIANHKGGSGKTTTAVNMAACLAEMQYQVLLIDLDPQSHASLSFGVEIAQEDRSIFWAMGQKQSDRAWLAEIAIPVGRGLALIPSAPLPIHEEEALMARKNRLFRLRELVQQVDQKYDFAVIDCPPALGILTCNAFMASQSAILPIETSFYAMNGVGRALEVIADLETRYNHTIRQIAVATLFDKRTSLARDILEELRRYFRGAMTETVIRQSIHLREAASHGQPITLYAPSSRGCRDYCEMTEEFLQRIAGEQPKNGDCSEEVVLLGQMYGGGRETIDQLRKAGFTTLESIRRAQAKKMGQQVGVSAHVARQMIRHAARMQLFPEREGPTPVSGRLTVDNAPTSLPAAGTALPSDEDVASALLENLLAKTAS